MGTVKEEKNILCQRITTCLTSLLTVKNTA